MACAGSAAHRATASTSAAASASLASDEPCPRTTAPGTYVARSGGSRSAPNWRSGTSGASA